VDIGLPECDLPSRAAVILECVASSGHNLAAAKVVVVVTTHAVLEGGVLKCTYQAGVDAFWRTDCIAHSANVVGLAQLLAPALKAEQNRPWD
jgi:ribose-phosphate pyrophosphokinase